MKRKYGLLTQSNKLVNHTLTPTLSLFLVTFIIGSRGESKSTRNCTINLVWNSSATIKGHPQRHPFQQMTAVFPFHPTPIEI